MVDIVVTSQDDSYELKLADDAGIEHLHFDRERFDSADAFYHDLVERMHARSIDYILMFEYGFYIPEFFIEAFYPKILAIHPSLTPTYIYDEDAGVKAARDIVEANGDVAGVTAYLLKPGGPGGHVLQQEKVAVFDSDNPFAIYQRVRKAEYCMTPIILKKWVSGAYQLQDDGHVVDQTVSA